MSADVNRAAELAESLRAMRRNAQHHWTLQRVMAYSITMDSARLGDLSDAADLLEELAQSLDFHRRRVDALQSWQGSMRDPERTVVCDIIANGHTLAPQFAGDRYGDMKAGAE